MHEAEILVRYSKEEQKKISLALDFIKKNLPTNIVEHDIRTAKLLTEKHLGFESIVVGLLHSIEINNADKEKELRNLFGNNVVDIIKEKALILRVVKNNFPKIPAETMSSLILSIASDLNTIIIRIAELVDSLKYRLRGPAESKKLAKIASEIYSPLALKLGISDFNWKLQDYGFEIENPEAYNKIKKLVGKTRTEREKIILDMKKQLEQLFKEKKINAQVFGRPKNFKSIFEKMEKTPFKKIHDIYGMRILCNKETDCYEVLGHIHSLFNFIKVDFDDYIAKPKKENGKEYKSIHTAIQKEKEIIEIQIRTWQQHLKIESSIYWEYKRLNKDSTYEKELSWERQLLEWQKQIGQTPSKQNKLNKKIFAFTPKHEVISLPLKATALYFAFAIHTDIGKKAVKAKVNGTLVHLDTLLKNLDLVEIITSKKVEVKRNWLGITVSEKARDRIKNYLGITGVVKRKKTSMPKLASKKIKLAECCHPLPGEDVIGVKTTKRKIIIHKRNCKNLINFDKSKILDIEFEKDKGKTKILVTALDTDGLLAEILDKIRASKVELITVNFKIKKTGYVEAQFAVEVRNVKRIEQLMTKINELPAIKSVTRE
jgi:GTP diphosphokinase / guanosine-3',5'-bis(diphosphate) 3'-diphosphatase